MFHMTGPEGQHFYLLGSGSFVANGTPMERVRNSGWHQVPFIATWISKVINEYPVVDYYRLKDPQAASPAFPAVLSVEDYQFRTQEDDYDDSPEYHLYEPVMREVPPTYEEVDVSSFINLDGEPCPKDGRTWVTQLPYELSRHPELLHRYPGYLSGFKDAVKLAIQRRLGLREGLRTSLLADVGCEETYKRVGYLTAWKTVPYLPTHYRQVPKVSRATGKPLKATKEIVETTKLEYTFQCPERIEGSNRAEAAAYWDTLMDELVEKAMNALEVSPCWHCKGTGIVQTDS